MSRLLAGLLLCTPLPAMYGRLRRSAASYDAPTPTDVAVARTQATAAHLPERTAVAPVVPVVENRPSDPQPVVTPLRAKAGGVRRAVQGTPCHDCRCCAVYSQRLADAHREIDRLRDEVLNGGARHVNTYPLNVAATAGGGDRA